MWGLLSVHVNLTAAVGYFDDLMFWPQSRAVPDLMPVLPSRSFRTAVLVHSLKPGPKRLKMLRHSPNLHLPDSHPR